MARTRGVSALCLVLLLAAGSSFAQDCLQKTRTLDTQNIAVRTQNAIIDKNLECIFYDICEDNSPADAIDINCDCVPYYDCQRGPVKGPIVIQLNKIQCENSLDVCCSKQNQKTKSNNDVIPNGTKTLTNNGTPPPPPNFNCGQRNEDGVGFRVTGNDDGEAQFGEFPWMVALLEIKNGKEVFIGGGSLIHPGVVLTAAHSVVKFKRGWSKLRARAGEWDSRNELESIKFQQLEVKEVIIHEDYNSGTRHNDIALLVLRDEVEPAGNVGTLCMPAQGATSTSDQCIATGWGKSSFGNSGCYQVILKSILLPIVPRSQCEMQLSRTRPGRKYTLPTTATCAGGESGKDTCKGDGGGPLACPIPNDEDFYEQGGIVSWGIGCGVDDVPGVYTDVAQFRGWVDEKFNERNLDTESYQRPF